MMLASHCHQALAIRAQHAIGMRYISSLAKALGNCSTQSLVDALWSKGWPNAMITNARPLTPGQKMVGEAVTLRFVPQRPDINADKPSGALSPEYVAFEMCGPDQVLVCSSVGPWESIGGDIKFLRLQQNKIAGLVTDGSVRDTHALRSYGFPVYSHSVTAKQGPAFHQPWGVNEVVDVNGTVVRPGDYIVGDDDGVVVIPKSVAQECLTLATEREECEDIIKDELNRNPTSPGLYYPFKKPVPRESPLGKLLSKHGIEHQFSSRNLSSTPSRSKATTSASNHATMKAAVVVSPGDSRAISIEDIAIPEDLDDGEVLVHNSYSGVNFIDTYHRSGLYKRDLPFTLGQEATGVIKKSSPKAEAEGLIAGTNVLYSNLQTYSEYSKVPFAKLIEVPEGVGLDTACVLPVQGLTALYLVTMAPAGLLPDGGWILIHAAGGGTGQLAVQIAKASGYKIIGTCSSSKVDFVKTLGCDVVIDYSKDDVVEKVNEATGGSGVHCVLDGVGMSTYEASLKSLGRRGICIFFGNASGPVPPISPLELIGKSNYIHRPKLLDYFPGRSELINGTDQLFDLMKAGSLKVTIDRSFALADAKAAHDYLEAGKARGKVLLEICQH